MKASDLSLMKFPIILGLMLCLLAFSCEKEEPVVEAEPEPELYPSNIYLSLQSENAPSIITYEDVCSSEHTPITLGGSGSIGAEPHYYSEIGVAFYDAPRIERGRLCLIYKGLQNNLDPLDNMVTLLEKANEEHTEEEPKLMPYLRIKYQGETYTSTRFDKLYAEFGHTDPNKEETYSYEIKTPNPTRGCIDHQRVLAVDYQFKGYLYNWHRTDSMYVDSADMKVQTVIYGF